MLCCYQFCNQFGYISLAFEQMSVISFAFQHMGGGYRGGAVWRFLPGLASLCEGCQFHGLLRAWK